MCYSYYTTAINQYLQLKTDTVRNKLVPLGIYIVAVPHLTFLKVDLENSPKTENLRILTKLNFFTRSIMIFYFDK